VRLCPTLQGWGDVVEWWGEEDKDERGTRVVDGNCDIGSKMAGAAQCRMQNGDESLTNDIYTRCDDST